MNTGRVAVKLALAALAADMLVSANFLSLIGDPYVSDGGSLFTKMHPGSYLAAFACVARLSARGRPLQAVWQLAVREQGLCVFGVAIGACALCATCTTGTGNAIVLIDTFLPAFWLAVVVKDLDPGEMAILRKVLRGFFVLNALLALGETALATHLIPLYLNGRPYHELSADFRPTALYDHPLTGATATMLGLLMTPRQGAKSIAVWGYYTLLAAALVVFGGRIAAVVTILSFAGLAALQMRRAIVARRVNVFRLLLSSGVILLVGFAAIAAMAAGLGERLQDHLYWDASAQVRLQALHIFEQFSLRQWLFGCQRSDLIALLEPLRLEYAVDVIENFWLLMLATLGLPGFAVFAGGIVALVSWCWWRANGRGRLILVSFFLAVSTSNSLGRKSTLLVILLAVVLSEHRLGRRFVALAGRPLSANRSVHRPIEALGC